MSDGKKQDGGPAFAPFGAPEPPAPVWETVCWIEWHRAGTMAVEVCENRLVSG